MYLVGGAAIALSFDAARTTRDLDAVFAPTTEVRAAAAEVAQLFDLPEDRLNDAVKGFIPPTPDSQQVVVYESQHLRVCTAGLEHLLAMKIAAARVEQDRGDLELLVRALEISTVEQALDIAATCLGPSYPIPPRAQYLLEEIFEGNDPSPKVTPWSGPSPSQPQFTQFPNSPSRYDGPSLS